MNSLFPEMQSNLVRCRDCQHCNPVMGMGSICALKPTADRRYPSGYVKVYPMKPHYCRMFVRS